MAATGKTDLGPGWADRVAWPEPEGGSGEQRLARRKPTIKAKRASDHAVMVRRGAARTKAERQLTRALDEALPLPPEVDE